VENIVVNDGFLDSFQKQRLRFFDYQVQQSLIVETICFSLFKFPMSWLISIK